MELPEDVLSIVRAYSRPLFTYHKEYHHALKVLGKKQWLKLKEKLHEEPSVVLPALHTYLEVFLRKQEVYRLRDKMKSDLDKNNPVDRWVQENEMYNRVFYAKRAEEDVFWLLIRLLYGDGKEYWDFKEDRWL